MVWILVGFQVIASWALWWTYRVYHSQPRENHPSIFWNPLVRSMLIWLPFLITLGLPIVSFFLVDHPWEFVIFAIVAFFWTGWSTVNPTESSAQEEEEITSFNSAICRMINLRRTVDPRLRRKPAAEHWTKAATWDTPEAFIANTVELFQVLIDDGFSEHEILEKLRNPRNLDSATHDNLVLYLQNQLKTIDPGYISLGSDLLERAIEIAGIGARIALQNFEKQFPPNEWLEDEPLSEEAFKARLAISGDSGGSRCGGDKIRVELRRRQGDEIRQFATPSELRSPIHKRGFALVRNKEIIDIIETDVIRYVF